MHIGVPAETLAGETRVAVTPETVKKLVAQGHSVSVQSGAGVAASVPDEAYVAAGANIVDAQIFTTTDGRALDTISVSREFEQDDDEARRAQRIADTIEKALKGALRLPEVMARRGGPKGWLKAFAIEPDVTINNQWSNRYTVIEVTGLDRPGLLYELTATLSKLSLNITSAHVATFGERVVDVFYVTDLLGAKLSSPTREIAIKRALLQLFGTSEESGKETATARAGAAAK